MTLSALVGAETAAPVHDTAARMLTRQAQDYEHGEGVVRDQARAASLYCEAARLGDAEAMYALGWMYANGRGLERNDGYAGTLFAMAAMLGNTHAEKMMRFTGDYTGALPACMFAPPEALPDPVSVEGLISAVPAVRRDVAQLLVRLAPQYGITPRFALAIGLTESRLDPAALSPKSAMGVMQLIPATAERFNVKNPYDPEQNIRGGLAYLRWLLAYFKGDVALAAAGYNAGEGAVDRHRGVPPYRETRGYVQRILEVVRHRQHPYDHKVVAPSAVLSGLGPTERNGQGS
jgi:soluble lytic murein transglycosylase-like protein